MSIHLRDVIQRTPIESLRAYLGFVSPTASETVDWTMPRSALVSTLVEVFLTFEEPTRNRALADVDRVAQFTSDEHGRQMLRAVLPYGDDLLERFDALEDVTACAFFVLMRDEDVFEHALSALYAQRLLNGRDWTGLDFEPDARPTVRKHPSIDDFEARLRDIFATIGPSPRIVVERFSRHDLDPAGSGSRTREQFSVYFEVSGRQQRPRSGLR